MDSRHLILLGSGIAVFPLLVLLLPVIWPLFALIGVVLVGIGVLRWLFGSSDSPALRDAKREGEALLDCPHCGSLEERTRDACRLCGEELPDADETRAGE